jgi:tetratricopeptide (TPR) repeat protein/TolB-like protein
MVVSITTLLSAYLAIRPSALFAQCPDGSAPPCRVTATTPARVAIDSNAVAILPFRVSGPPETQYLREGMLDLLSVALDGFAGWRVIQPRAFLRQVNTNAGPMNVPQASRLAREAGAGTFVLGNVVALGPELRVQAELYESARGTSLASVRARGSVALPAPVADSIAGGLARRRLALHGGATRHALEEYTTTSPVALQAYLVAEQLARHARWQEAAESLTVAIGLDSTFALASYALYRAITWGNSGPIFQRASDRAITPYSIEDVIQAAIRHLDRAPPRQRRLLEFAAATNRAESLRLADGLTQDYPDDADAWLERGDAYFHVGLQSGESPTRSLESLQRAIALDPLVPEAYLHVVQLRSMLGDSAGAWQALRQLRAMAPTWEATQGLDLAMRAAWRREDPATLPAPSPEIATIIGRYMLLILDRTPARAVALADSFAAVASAPDHAPAERATALLRRHVYQLAQGRYADAWEMLRRAAVLDAAGPEVQGATVLHCLVTGTHEPEARDAARQLKALDAARPLWASAVLAWLVAATGAVDSARTAVPRLLAGGEYPTFRAALTDGLTGLVTLRTGDSLMARRELAQANVAWIEIRNIEEFFPNPYLAVVMARLDRRAGDLEVAERHLSETIGPIGVVFRADAEELRGQIAEQRGDTVSAIRAYQNFIELWKSADPELRPRVAAARAAIEKLRTEKP